MKTAADQLAARLDDRSAVVGVLGLGYVGLPLARVFHDAGFRLLGFDTDAEKVERLRKGVNYISHFGATFAQPMIQSGRFEAMTDFERLAEPDVILICVPTPLGPHHDPDLSYILQTLDDLAGRLRPGQLVVLESTTYPTTTRDIVQPYLESSGLRCGEDFFLAFSPEREDPGRADHSTRTIPKLVGGVDPVSTRLGAAFYRCGIDSVVEVSNAEIAEAAKLLENIYRSVNIALVNELKTLLSAMDIDVWSVIEAASTKPFGFHAFYPGPGVGGHCIPIDPFYLTWKAHEVGLPTRFIELAGQVNEAMPDYVIERLVRALNDDRKPVNGSRILVLGLAYKRDIADVRESPSLELIERLLTLGANVEYNDPHVPSTHKMRRHDLHMTSVELTPEGLAGYDCVLVATDHSDYDWSSIAAHSRLIVDTRNVIRGDVAARVVRA